MAPSELARYEQTYPTPSVAAGAEKEKVCWCVEADKVRSRVATSSYLMADVSKCIWSHTDPPVDTLAPHSISAPFAPLWYSD